VDTKVDTKAIRPDYSGNERGKLEFRDKSVIFTSVQDT